MTPMLPRPATPAALGVAALAAVASLASLAPNAAAQSLASRIGSAPDGAVQFTFSARPGVCGNGRSFLSTGGNIHVGTWYGTINDATRSEGCQPGPVRVVLTRIDRTVTDVNTYAGPPSATPGAADLGRVSAREAADFLLDLAARGEGRPSRDAILPAMLADSTSVAPALVGLARDQGRPRETRRSAITWLGREIDERGGGGVAPAQGARTLVEIARDENDNQQVRQHAMSVLSRLESGEGIPALIELSRGSTDTWLAKQAMQTLARSGDPRARQYLRAAAQRSDLSDEVRAAVLTGIGGEYATGADAAFLREQYRRTDGERSRDAIVSAMARMGGSENARWLLGIARDAEQPMRARRRAVQVAEQAGAPPQELVRLYDQVDARELKEALLGAYAKLGTRLTTDKLLAVAKNDTDVSLRRRAVSYMSRSEDPRVREALREIVERP